MLFIASYQNQVLQFPDDFIEFSKKDDKWHADFCKAIYSEYLRDRTGSLYSNIDFADELRAYGDGRQDPDKYKNLLSKKSDSNSQQRKGYMNINWDILPVAVKYKQTILGMFDDVEHDIVADAIDEQSGTEKENKKWYFWSKLKLDNFLKSIDQAAGIDNSAKNDEGFKPRTLHELELYSKMGGFKLGVEASMEKLLRFVFKDSNWVETKRKIIEDFIDLNMAACKDYVEPDTQRIKTRYVDPSRLIIQWSKHFDHHDSKYAGEVRKVPIDELRTKGGFSEEEIRSIAKNVWNNNQDQAGYDNADGWAYYNSENEDGSYNYDNFKVDVMDAEYASFTRKFKTTRKNQRGEKFTYESKHGKVWNTDKRKTKITDIKVIHKATWIIGTDFVYDWGLQNDVPRPDNSEARLSYHLYKGKGRSITDRCRVNYDNMQLAWLKFQNALSMAKNPGLAVEWGALSNMSLKNKKMSPFDILQIRRDTGDLVYKATTHRGQVNSPASARPVQEIGGGMGTQLDEFVKIFDTNRAMIQEFSGVTAPSAGSEPKAEIGLGVQELAVAATNNALKPLYKGYVALKQFTAESICLRGQIVIKYNKKGEKAYYPIIGAASTKSIKISSDMTMRQYGIILRMRPTEQKKQVIRQALIKAMEPGRDGSPGLGADDYLLIERLLDHGQLKEAEAQINLKLTKAKKQAELSKQQAIQLQGQQQQQLEQVKTQEAQKRAQIETQSKIQLENAKAQAQIQIEQAKLQMDLERIQAQSVADARLAEVQSENKIEEQSFLTRRTEV
jgi:hypothetical protein